jgi:hypothetical protein
MDPVAMVTLSPLVMRIDDRVGRVPFGDVKRRLT